MIPPRGSADRFRCVWLLLTASIGLDSANVRLQVQSDNLLLNLGLRRVIDVLQMLYKVVECQLAVQMAHTVDGILITGKINALYLHPKAVSVKFNFGTMVHGPGHLRNFGFKLCCMTVSRAELIATISLLLLSKLRSLTFVAG